MDVERLREDLERFDNQSRVIDGLGRDVVAVPKDSPIIGAARDHLACGTSANSERISTELALGTVTDEMVEAFNDWLHLEFGEGLPACSNACTHVVAGEWTALGMANVLSRAAFRVETGE